MCCRQWFLAVLLAAVAVLPAAGQMDFTAPCVGRQEGSACSVTFNGGPLAGQTLSGVCTKGLCGDPTPPTPTDASPVVGGSAECATDGSDAGMIIKITPGTGIGGGLRRMASTGCGAHDWTTQSTPNSANRVESDRTVPTLVRISKTPTVVGIGMAGGPMMGEIGVALDGITIFAPADADKRDALKFEGVLLGHCGAHPAGMAGVYHYHGHPGVKPTNCVYDVSLPQTSPLGNRARTLCEPPLTGAVCSEFTDDGKWAWYSEEKQRKLHTFGAGAPQAGSHSLLLGFMADGIPIYGLHGSDGKPPADLDMCKGHATDLGIYHYHPVA